MTLQLLTPSNTNPKGTNVTIPTTNIDEAWARAYYGQLQGMKITGIVTQWDEESRDTWVRLIAERTNENGSIERFSLEISQDAEGNGPGFLFGLPSVRSVRQPDGSWAIETEKGLIPV